MNWLNFSVRLRRSYTMVDVNIIQYNIIQYNTKLSIYIYVDFFSTEMLFSIKMTTYIVF